jgi:hypothetical protein
VAWLPSIVAISTRIRRATHFVIRLSHEVTAEEYGRFLYTHVSSERDKPLTFCGLFNDAIEAGS